MAAAEQRNADTVAPQEVCPRCNYPYIIQDRQGWFCLNGGCGRFDQPAHSHDHEADNPQGVWCCQEHRNEHYARTYNDSTVPNG